MKMRSKHSLGYYFFRGFLHAITFGLVNDGRDKPIAKHHLGIEQDKPGPRRVRHLYVNRPENQTKGLRVKATNPKHAHQPPPDPNAQKRGFVREGFERK